MLSALVWMFAGAASAASGLEQLPAFVKDQTTLENSFPVAEKCLAAFEKSGGTLKFQEYGRALIALEARENMSNLDSQALSRDCVVWFLGYTAGKIDGVATSEKNK